MVEYKIMSLILLGENREREHVKQGYSKDATDSLLKQCISDEFNK